MTGANAKIKKIYVGENLVRPVWKPGSNTVLYYPFTSDSNDYSGNGYNLSVRSGTITYSNYGADFSNGILEARGTFSNLPTGTSARTVALRFKAYDLSRSETWFFGEGKDDTQKFFCICLRTGKVEVGVWGSSGRFTSNVTVSDNNYHCLIITFSGSTVNIYLDSFSSASGTGSITINSGNTVITAGGLPQYGRAGAAVVGRLVLENKIWSEDERLNYYNQTKSNYGL